MAREQSSRGGFALRSCGQHPSWWLVTVLQFGLIVPLCGQARVIVQASNSNPVAGISNVLAASFPKMDDEADYNQAPFSIEVLPNGHFVVVTFSRRVLEYASNGAFLYELGRSGSGPGEFLYPRYSLTMGTRHSVIDVATARWTDFDTQGHLIGSKPFLLADMYSLVAGPGDRLFASGSYRTPSAAGLPLHQVSDSGRIIRSFGSKMSETHRSDRSEDLRRVLAMGPGGLLFAGVPSRYDIEVYRAGDGTHIRSYVGEFGWFPPDARYISPTPLVPPVPQLQSIFVDDQSRLWVATLVPSKTWAEALGDPFVDNAGNSRYHIETIANLYDTRVDVIALVDGRLLGTSRLKGYAVQFTGHGQIALFRQRPDDGLGYVRIESLELLPPPRAH